MTNPVVKEKGEAKATKDEMKEYIPEPLADGMRLPNRLRMGGLDFSISLTCVHGICQRTKIINGKEGKA